jgi:hypothetical protein
VPRLPRVKLMVAAANRWGRGGRETEARLVAMRRRRLRGGRMGRRERTARAIVACGCFANRAERGRRKARAAIERGERIATTQRSNGGGVSARGRERKKSLFIGVWDKRVKKSVSGCSRS